MFSLEEIILYYWDKTFVTTFLVPWGLAKISPLAVENRQFLTLCEPWVPFSLILVGDSFPCLRYFYHTGALINVLLNLKVETVPFSGDCFLCDSFFSLVCLMNFSCIGIPRHSALSLQLKDSAGPSVVFPLCFVIRKLSQGSKLKQPEVSLLCFSYPGVPVLGYLIYCSLETNASSYILSTLFVWGQRTNLVPKRTFLSGKMEVLT